MMKNGVYFLVIALLVTELFKNLIYANWMKISILAQILHILLFYTTLCPNCDVTSHIICINQNLE